MSPPEELPGVILITDWSLGGERLRRVLEEVLPLGPRVALQHRHPGAGGRQFLEEARMLATLCAPGGNPLFINGRLDVALLVGGHLHAPAHGPRAGELRRLLPSTAWLSVAVHDLAEADDARSADLALVSPLFSPGSKPHGSREPLGAARWEQLAQGLGCPAYALGGISSGTVGGVPSRAHGVAVVSAVWKAERPAETVAALLSAGQARARDRAESGAPRVDSHP